MWLKNTANFANEETDSSLTLFPTMWSPCWRKTKSSWQKRSGGTRNVRLFSVLRGKRAHPPHPLSLQLWASPWLHAVLVPAHPIHGSFASRRVAAAGKLLEGLVDLLLWVGGLSDSSFPSPYPWVSCLLCFPESSSVPLCSHTSALPWPPAPARSCLGHRPHPSNPTGFPKCLCWVSMPA